MTRVLATEPFRMALDASGGGIAHWKHDPLHDVVEPMTHHVIMAYNGAVQRMERRSGRFVASGTFRPGVVIIIPEGSSSRWDIPKPVDVVQLYLPHRTLARVADEADTANPIDLLERTAHPDPITSRLLLSAADVLESNATLDTLFRQQLTDLLATRLLGAHTGAPAAVQPVVGGLAPKVLMRAIERLRSESDADVSLAALAAEAGLSRFHFCRAFKESTGLSPHCLAAPAPARAGDANAARDRRVGRDGRRRAWLRLSDSLRSCIQTADRRYPDGLAPARALAAIALQSPQWRWGSGTSGSLDEHRTYADHTEKKNGLERLTQSACKHLTPEGPRDLGHVRDFTHRPLFDGDRRRIKPLEIRGSMDRSDNVSDHEGWRTDLLQGLGTEVAQPIVFHHGWPLCADDWDTQMLYFLGKGYRVIAHDRRGHGRSSQIGDGHDMDHYAADAAAVVDHLDLRDAIHVGHSTGGGEAARYVARHGSGRVAKLVLISAVPRSW